MNSLIAQLNDDAAAVIERAQNSLVQIAVGHRSGGSGIVWSADGYVLTNAHVIRQEEIHVLLPGGEQTVARLLAYDKGNDLALIQAEAAGLTPIAIGDSETVEIGEMVFALGFPWGVPNAVTAGIVTGNGASLPGMPGSGRQWLALSLHLRPGHSGGPVIDSRGRLVGINTMMAGLDVGLAVPVNVARQFVEAAQKELAVTV